MLIDLPVNQRLLLRLASFHRRFSGLFPTKTSCKSGFVLAAGIALATTGLAEQHLAKDANSTFRVATFNAAMHRDSPNGLLQALRRGTLASDPDRQIATVATIIRQVRPDIILINEFDYLEEGESITLFKQRYLEMEIHSAGRPALEPVFFPYHFIAPTNTGVPSGVDLNNDSDVAGAADNFGYGVFPGQYGMLVLSRFPIVQEQVRTFQKFLWRDMPDAHLPTIPSGGGEPQSYYSKEALSIFRLSSKSHWDIPVNVNGKTTHLLASHPTPPVFDGPEDRNGLRNHDEIRFWADYINETEGHYIYDDNRSYGALANNSRFIILGDLNASPVEGDSTNNPMRLLLQHSAVIGEYTPVSNGAKEQQPNNRFAPAHTTAWSLRVDYVLPSRFGLRILDGGVYWPSRSEQHYELVENKATGSDHRLVWLDIETVSHLNLDN